ncbi:MAG: ATP-binding protein [Rhodospirillaceae bacterium]
MHERVKSKRRMTWQPVMAAELGGRTIVWTLGLFAAATGAAFLSQLYGKTITAPLVYLLGVTVIGATQGLLPGVAAALTASAVYNFAITDPVFVFRLADADDLVPLLAFNLSALISGMLAGRLKDRAAEAQRASRELSTLLEASRVLQGIFSIGDFAAALPRLARLAGFDSAALLINADDDLREIETASGERLQIGLVRDLELRMRDGALPEQVEGWLVFGIYAVAQPLGVLLVRKRDEVAQMASPASLDAFVNMVAITIERCSLLERLASSKAIERSEAFKTALLSSVSHDMRTPLSAISASASSLREYEDKLVPEVRTRLLTTITEQCERLNRYTANLLNLGRAQSGLSPETMPVIDVVEVLGRAVNGIRTSLDGRVLEKRLPIETAFVKADAILLEQVFHNVLENAVLYSDSPSTIDVRLETNDMDAVITVADEGIGIPARELEKVFERFYRSDQSSRRSRGSGLGLAIAKAFTDAVGGQISAASPVTPSGGTRISIVLPLFRASV